MGFVWGVGESHQQATTRFITENQNNELKVATSVMEPQGWLLILNGYEKPLT